MGQRMTESAGSTEPFQCGHTRSQNWGKSNKMKGNMQRTRVKIFQAEGTGSTKDFGPLICFV